MKKRIILFSLFVSTLFFQCIAIQALAADCQNWSSFADIGGIIKYKPAIYADSDTKLVIAAVGTDDALWINEYNPQTGKNEWYSLGGVLITGPNLVLGADGKITASGIGGDDMLWKRIYQSSKNWTEWQNTGSTYFSGNMPNQAAIGGSLYRVVKGSSNSVKIEKCANYATCVPGAVLGCKVCNSDGSVWQDDDSKCAGGKICLDGSCVLSSGNYNDGLVGWWKFDGENGESSLLFKDWSGFGNHQICNLSDPCPTLAAGKFGKALKFTGNNSLEAVVSPTLKDITEHSYTWSAWYNPASIPVYDQNEYHSRQAIICKPGFHTNINFASDRRFHFGSYTADDRFFGVSSLATYDVGQWHHLAATVDTNAKTAAFYVDGVLQGKTTYEGNPRNHENLPLSIGICSEIGMNHDWLANGLIDDVRVYSRALTENDIKAVYNGKANPNPFTGKKDKYDCDIAGQTQGCKICRPLTMKWADDSTQCGKGQVCVDGGCITGTPPIPATFDVTVSKSGNIATAKNKNGGVISSGSNYTQVIRAAIAATPDDGSLYIGPGIYDGLVAGQKIANFYTVFSLEGKNMHIYGAGMGKTILKLGNNQHYYGHPALIFYATGYEYYGASYSALTLANMTFDGNRNNQTDLFVDGAGLVLTGGRRSGGKFFNLELINSADQGIYWGNGAGGAHGDYAGNWEAYGYMHNLQNRNNFWEAITFDNVQKIRASDLKSEYDSLNEDFCGTGMTIINVGDHDLDIIIDGLTIKNGHLTSSWGTHRGGGGITINDLTINAADRNNQNGASSHCILFAIANEVKLPLLVQNPKPITININSITGNSSSNSIFPGGVYIKNSTPRVTFNGGSISDYIAVNAVNSNVTINGTRLKSANNSLVAQNSKVNCTNCVLEPAPGKYMYSSIGSGAQINFANSFTTSMERTEVSGGGKVTGSLSILRTVCVPGVVSGCKFCKADGSAWQDDNSKCGANQTCQNGTCVNNPACVAKTCTTLGNYQCGDWSDGCGKTINCGTCGSNQTCSAGQCVATCASTCSLVGAKQCSGNGYQTCALSGGCLKWGATTACAAGTACNSGNCVATCVAKTCDSQGYKCGSVSDGCGKTLSCGSCSTGQTCVSGQCQTNCVAKTCAGLGNYQCGDWPDGCGKTINCGACPPNQTCSTGKCVSNCSSHASKKCDNGNLYWYNSCNTKEELAQNCGIDQTTDNYQCSSTWIQRKTLKKGCANNACFETSQWDNTTNCANSNKICANGVCAATCQPNTCANIGFQCGDANDGCGKTINCGSCAAGKTCSNGQCIAQSGGGGGGGGGGGMIEPQPPSREASASQGKINRGEILAKIAQIKQLLVQLIIQLIAELQKQLAAMPK